MKVIEFAFTVYPVAELKRAREFYEGTFGLKPGMVYEGEKMGWVEYEVGTGVFAIGSGAEMFKPSVDGGTIAFEMEDFEEAIRELKGSGCKFVFEAMETPVCRMAGVLDPDGNAIIVHKRKG